MDHLKKTGGVTGDFFRDSASENEYQEFLLG